MKNAVRLQETEMQSEAKLDTHGVFWLYIFMYLHLILIFSPWGFLLFVMRFETFIWGQSEHDGTDVIKTMTEVRNIKTVGMRSEC